MKAKKFIWLPDIVDKLDWKHNVSPQEVEEIFANQVKYRFVEKGSRTNEDIYMALGQTESGRYLAILFIRKLTNDYLILSARDMAKKERRLYGRK
jgi:uncharacterized DUF497 family protein